MTARHTIAAKRFAATLLPAGRPFTENIKAFVCGNDWRSWRPGTTDYPGLPSSACLAVFPAGALEFTPSS